MTASENLLFLLEQKIVFVLEHKHCQCWSKSRGSMMLGILVPPFQSSPLFEPLVADLLIKQRMAMLETHKQIPQLLRLRHNK